VPPHSDVLMTSSVDFNWFKTKYLSFAHSSMSVCMDTAQHCWMQTSSQRCQQPVATITKVLLQAIHRRACGSAMQRTGGVKLNDWLAKLAESHKFITY